MKEFSAILLLLLCCSCQWVQKDKVSETELVKKKMAEINMNEVDVYPLFEDCDETSSKLLQKTCFEDHLRTLFNDLLSAQEFTVEEDINDTIYLYFVVDNTGKIQYRRTEKNSKLSVLLPNIDSLLESKTKELPNIYPAQKQGIKVASKCKLPIIIRSH